MATRETIDERVLNGYIAQAMEKQAPPGYTVGPEVHGQARLGNTSPDLVVRMPYDLRMIVETEYNSPAIGDAIDRLGYEFHDHTRDVKNVIALGIPSRLGSPRMRYADRDIELMSDSPEFLMQVVTGRSPDDPNIVITPEKPIPVSLRDVIQYAWLAAIPDVYAKNVLKNVTANLLTARNELARSLSSHDGSNASVMSENILGFKYGNPSSGYPVESAAGNVVGTLVSMIELHRNLHRWGRLSGILPIDSAYLWNTVSGDGIPSRIAIQWRKIEAVDYKPLSTIAAEMLEDAELSAYVGRTLKTVHDTIEEYFEAGLSATTNVSAAVWQELTPDRDQRAVNYTRPHRAEFLANMATARLEQPRMARYAEICAGTGTLARATEENIRFRHYAESDDKSSIHAERMKNRIQLTDISQQSVSVATANLTSLEPQTSFEHSNIFAITSTGGALKFLGPKGVAEEDSRLVGSFGEEVGMLALDAGSVGICCNNDPYFRSRGGAKNPIPSKDMNRFKRQADRRVKGVANGNAGLATFMHVIEHAMLARGAPHGKVLPLLAATGDGYKGFRRNIENEYKDVIAVSTAAGGGDSMSDDTNIQEMLLIGTKHETGDRAVVCVNLVSDFTTKIEGKMFGDAIRHEIAKGKPFGEIEVGKVVGSYIRMENLEDGRPWSALGSSGDYTLLTEFLLQGFAWFPATGSKTKFALPMTRLGDLSNIGPGDDLLGRFASSTSPRGAFVLTAKNDTVNRLNPFLWEIDSDLQTTITCSPTHYGVPRGDTVKAERMSVTAGRFQFNRNFRQDSQRIAMAYTEEDCMGGRAWTTLSNFEHGVGEATTLFLNSTFGMIVRIGYGQFSGQGGSVLGVGAIGGHPVPDFKIDSDAGETAREIAINHFGKLRMLELERVSWSALDANRAKVDEVVSQMLGLEWNLETEGMLASWRNLMCQQKIVHCGRKIVLEPLRAAGVVG